MGKAFRIKRVVLLYLVLIVLGFAAGYLLINGKLGLRCLFRDLTGFKCPGCGNTNGMLAMLNGDFFAPIKFNLMFYPEVFTLLYILIYLPYIYITGKNFSKRAAAALIILATVYITWGIIRNFINL